MHSIGGEERRLRLARRHHLADGSRADAPADVAAGLVALHGSDPASVYLACLARLRQPDTAAVERALYEERSLVRMLGMRRTVFAVPRDAVGVVQSACTRAIAVLERRRSHQLLEAAGLGDGAVASWLEDVEASTLRALERRGEATAAELAGDEPRLRTPIVLAEGKPYAASQSITTRVLFLLAADGRIVRARPRGSWISSQYRWSPIERWLGAVHEPPPEMARIELARRWLRVFGPGTLADLRWWAGWTAGDARRALAGLATVEVDLDGQTGYVLADDVDPPAGVAPWAALLPALDPTPMGWAARGWFLGPHAEALFDRTGNVGPTVWWDGRVVGGWAQRRTGEVVFRLLEDVGREAAAAVEREAVRLAAAVGAVRVTPRFRTPLERQLTA